MGERKKVLLVGSSPSDKGGIATVITNILSSRITEEFQFNMVETYMSGGLLRRTLFFAKGLTRFLANMLFHKPSVVHIHMSHKGSFYRKSLFILLSKWFGVPTITHIHGSSFKVFYANLGGFARRFCHYIFKQTDKVVVLSESWKEYFARLVDPNNIEVLYNAVEYTNYTFSKNNDAVKFLFLGRLSERKGVYDLLEMIKNIKRQRCNAYFYLAGDGEIDKVKARIAQYAIEPYVDVLGWIDGERKTKLLQECDVLILPSYNEGLPMAILEAMNYGMAILTTPVGGIPEVISDGRNGYLVTPGDIADMTSKAAALIDDHERRRQIGRFNQMEIKEKYNLSMFLSGLRQLYLKTIN